MPPSKRRTNRSGASKSDSLQPGKEGSPESPLSPPPRSTSPDESHTTTGDTTNGRMRSGSAAGGAGTGENASTVNGGEVKSETTKKRGRTGDNGSGDDNDDGEQQCPACTPESRELMSKSGSRKEHWIACDHCKTWYHWRCAGNGEDVGNIAKW